MKGRQVNLLNLMCCKFTKTHMLFKCKVKSLHVNKVSLVLQSGMMIISLEDQQVVKPLVLRPGPRISHLNNCN